MEPLDDNDKSNEGTSYDVVSSLCMVGNYCIVEMEAANNTHIIRNQDADTTSVDAITRLLSFSMLGDILDKNTKARFIISGSHQNRSLHFFHLCAVRFKQNIKSPHGFNSPRKCTKQIATYICSL